MISAVFGEFKMNSLERIANSVAMLGKDVLKDKVSWEGLIDEMLDVYQSYLPDEVKLPTIDEVYKKLKEDGIICDEVSEFYLNGIVDVISVISKTSDKIKYNDWRWLIEEVPMLFNRFHHFDTIMPTEEMIKKKLKEDGIWIED